MKKFVALTLSMLSLKAFAQNDLNTVKSLAGCYLVDYNYSERKALASDYKLDPRVYDVSGFAVKELVKVVDEGENFVRLQHFMQADSKQGKTLFMMRHHAEIWKKNAQFKYKYIGNFDGQNRWDVEALNGQWVRFVANLDDGLRYQCAGSWDEQSYHPKFSCDAYSPIPGRETRDMGRKDYNTMQRHTSIELFGNSWLEKQINQKIIFDKGEKIPLAEEIGKVWSVRLHDSECSNVDQWANARQAFWDILADVWKEALDGSSDYHEIKLVDGSTRSHKIGILMRDYYKSVASNAEHRELVKEKLRIIVESHRE